MKKFVLLIVAIGICVFGYYYMTNICGFYLDFDNEENIDVSFVTENDRIYHLLNNGEKEEFTVKGVNVTSSFNIHGRSEYYMGSEDYLRWFAMISDMGANAVKAFDIMDDDFYHALYLYNSENEKPLYLFQTVNLEDAVIEGPYSAYDREFMDAMISKGRMLVDILHGNRSADFGDYGYFSYKYDVSDWVIGYIIGSQFSQDMIIYTDKSCQDRNGYDGYFFSSEGSPFESAAAMIMDEISYYEYDKYNTLKLIGVSSDQSYDMLHYDDNAVKNGNSYERMIGKYATFDPEHIVSKDNLLSGYFASYNVYDFVDGFKNYLDIEDMEKYADILNEVDDNEIFGGYLGFISQYHDIPVIIGSVGFSSLYAYTTVDNMNSELSQGELLLETYNTVLDDGLSGMIVSTFNDEWDNRTWNVAYRYNNNNLGSFNDITSENEGFGLISFESGTVRIDGIDSEWNDEYLVHEGDMDIYVRFDEIGMCIMIDGYDSDKALYIPIDTTDRSGSNECSELNLNFSEDADFIVVIDSNESYLLVHERYDGARASYLKEINGENPYVSFPDIDSDSFVRYLMVMRNDDMDLLKTSNHLNTYDAGILKEDRDYKSSDVLEIRIPYGMLNFYDPESGLIHDDYYENYGVKGMKIKDIYIGADTDGDNIEMYEFEYDFEGDERSYYEKPKESYYMLKEYWKD